MLCRVEKQNGKPTFVPRTTLGDATFGSTTIKDWIKTLDKEDLLTKFDKDIEGFYWWPWVQDGEGSWH